MPELPEVERVRMSLLDHLIGRRVAGVTVRRAEVVERGTGGRARGGASVLADELLRGLVIRAIERKGKHLAIVAGEGGLPLEGCRAMAVHLGMTGSLTFEAAAPAGAAGKHAHLMWRLEEVGTRREAGVLVFDDPRRFGGVWTFDRFADLREARWSTLGDDALIITPGRLHESLRQTTRSLKAALLDQTVVAGLGNIYVDELLFSLGLHPSMRASRLTVNDVQRLVPVMRRLLRRAIASGGSSLRDYVDGNGAAGAFQLEHRVYGRGGEPCRRCERVLRTRTIAGRTTVWCSTCQGRR